MLTSAQITEWIEKTAAVMGENQAYLTQLDAAIGDADHGNNMDRGYKAALQQLSTEDDIGAILKSVAMALISKVGGAAGPLYGTMFLQAANALTGKASLSEEDVELLLERSVDGIKMRGRAEQGEKTILDSLIPAFEAFREARQNGKDMIGCLEAATAAAEKGMEATIPLIAKKGRASYLGDRSIGHQDPGATSTYLIVKTLRDVAAGAR